MIRTMGSASLVRVLAASTLALLAGPAPGDDGGPGTRPPPAAEDSSQPALPPAPEAPPPPPPLEVPSPPPAPDVEAQPGEPPGEWIYTDQYEWVWMPYGNDYAFVPRDGSAPDMYLYYPPVGWCWVIAPWVWGSGPMPRFGAHGPRFGWWGHGYGHWYGFRAGATGFGGRGYFGGGRWNAAPRAQGRAAAPAPRPQTSGHGSREVH